MGGAAEHPPAPPQTCHELSHTPSTAPLHQQVLTSPAATTPEHPHGLLLAKPQPRDKYSAFPVKNPEEQLPSWIPRWVPLHTKSTAGSGARDGINAAPIYRALIRSSSPRSFYSLYPFIRP